MAELNDFLSDPVALSEGVWIEVDPVTYGDLAILSRGFTDKFIDAQNAKLARAAEPYNGNARAIPNGVLRRINAELLREHLILGVRNLTDKGRVVELPEFLDLLGQEQANRLARACWDAAGRATARNMTAVEAAAGNSHRHSEHGSLGVPSESN